MTALNRYMVASALHENGGRQPGILGLLREKLGTFDNGTGKDLTMWIDTDPPPLLAQQIASFSASVVEMV